MHINDNAGTALDIWDTDYSFHERCNVIPTEQTRLNMDLFLFKHYTKSGRTKNWLIYTIVQRPSLGQKNIISLMHLLLGYCLQTAADANKRKHQRGCSFQAEICECVEICWQHDSRCLLLCVHAENFNVKSRESFKRHFLRHCIAQCIKKCRFVVNDGSVTAHLLVLYIHNSS